MLVIGATGFIGRRLTDVLLAASDEVHVSVRQPEHGFGCVVHPTERALDADFYGELIEVHRIEVVINLMAAGVAPTDRAAAMLMEVNASFPAHLARVSARAGVRAFVHMGSSAEYAPNPAVSVLTEDMPLETGRLYGASKAAGSLLVQAVARNAGLPFVVLRAFNIFGPGEKVYRLFPALAEGLRQGKPIDLSEGRQLRDFLYVDDACHALRRIAVRLIEQPDVSGVYNLASGVPVAVRDFARAVARGVGADEQLLKFGSLPLRPDDLPCVVADTSRLDRAIGPASLCALTDAIDRGLRAMNKLESSKRP